MSDIREPLLVQSWSSQAIAPICEKLPDFLSHAHSSFLSKATKVRESAPDDEILKQLPAIYQSEQTPIVSILSHSNGTLTFATRSGRICQITAYLKLLHILEESLPYKISLLLQSPSESIIAVLCEFEKLVIYKDLTRWELEGHNSLIVKIALNDKFIASADKSFEIIVWSTKTLSPKNRYQVHTKGILSLFYFRNSSKVISTSSDQTIHIWHSKDQFSLKGHVSEIQTAITSYNDRLIFSGGNDNTVRIWDVESKKLLKTLRGHQDNVNQVKLINNDLFVSAGDLSLIIWSSYTMSLVGILRGHTCAPTSVLCTSKYLYSASAETEIRMWDIESLKEVAVIEGHTKSINALAYYKDSVYSVSEDLSIRKNQTHSSGLVEALNGHNDWVLAIAISMDNRYILSGGGDKLIFVWKNHVLEDKLEGHTGWISRLGFIKNDTQFISCSFDKSIKIWDFQTKTCLFTKTGHTSAVYCLATGTDTFATGSFDSTIKIWTYTDNAEPKTCTGHENMVLGLTFSNISQEILSVSRDKKLKFWNSQLGKETASVTLEAYAICVCVANDQSIFITGSYDKKIRIWDYIHKEVIGVLDGHTEKIDAVRITSNGRFLISGSSDFSIKLWNMTDLSCITTFEAHDDRVRDIVLSKDERLIVSSSTDHNVKVWRCFNQKDEVTFQCVPNRWMGYYAFALSKTPEKWMKYCHVDEYNLNILHAYAYQNDYMKVRKALQEDVPFLTTVTEENPLSIAIKRNSVQSIIEILKYLNDLSIKQPGVFENYIRLIENEIPSLVKYNSPIVAKFLETTFKISENLVSLGVPKHKLPYVKKSKSFEINTEKFISKTGEVEDVSFTKSLFKLNIEKGSEDSISLLKNCIENSSLYEKNANFINTLINYKSRKNCLLITFMCILTILNTIVCYFSKQVPWLVLVFTFIYVVFAILELKNTCVQYFRRFENIAELIRIVCTSYFSIVLCINDREWDYMVIIFLVNLIKFFGLMQYCRCTGKCYFIGVLILNCLFNAVLTFVVIGTFLYAIDLPTNDMFIMSFSVCFGAVVFVLTGIEKMVYWDKDFEVKGRLRVLLGLEAILCWKKKCKKLRYLHSCQKFDLS